jgi:hypothetical protein
MTMSLDNLRTVLNPARTYLWNVKFVNPLGGGNTSVLEARCQSTSIPGRGVGEIVVPYKATAGVVFPGKATVDRNWTCTFIEGMNKEIWTIVNKWQNAINNPATGLGQPDLTVKRTVIYLSLQDQNDTEFLKIKLVGAFPKDRPSVPLSYEDDTAVHYSITFTFDYVDEA